MKETEMPQPLDQTAVAARCGIALTTVRKYHMVAERNRDNGDPQPGDMPAPDGQVGRSPWWYPSTIDAWNENRPKPGTERGGRPQGERGPEHLREVAKVFQAAEKAQKSVPAPATVIAEHFGVGRPTAYRWIRQAKEEGLLSD
ncbi:helix-turn-helix domain-containing protein [Streptomyces sp. NPDC093261]|uniref:helix-turn-helix domain-containing protein n=1 Tax=Streptomyces sp. NPDC093261 TaxID=3366037 RepID=UPI003818EBFB